MNCSVADTTNSYIMSSDIRDEQEKAYQQMMELPKADGWGAPHVFLYKGQWLLPDAVLGAIKMRTHFKPRSTDIFLSSFMKSGTTWLMSLMFATLNRSRFDFSSNHPLLRKGPHDCLIPLEFYMSQDYPFTNMDDLPSPCLFSSHFAHSLIPSSECKFVYVCRDPKDVLVSKWHFMSKLRSKERPTLSFNQAFELFCEGVSECGPYWDHVLGYWRASLESPDKILFLKYEEMKMEPEAQVKKLAAFMGVPFSVGEEENVVIGDIVHFCSFEHLKNLEVNKTGISRPDSEFELENKLYFRRGEVGDWENHLTEEMRERIDRITQDKFKGSGLTVGATPKYDFKMYVKCIT